MIESSALSRRLTVALTGVVSAPPIRRRFWIVSGLLALPTARDPDVEQYWRVERARVDDEPGELHPRSLVATIAALPC